MTELTELTEYRISFNQKNLKMCKIVFIINRQSQTVAGFAKALAKYKVTTEELPEYNEGCGATLFVIIVIVAIYFFGGSTGGEKILRGKLLIFQIKLNWTVIFKCITI